MDIRSFNYKHDIKVRGEKGQKTQTIILQKIIAKCVGVLIHKSVKEQVDH